MFLRFLPRGIRKYVLMSKKQQKHEIRLTLWYIPLYYVLGALIIAGLTTYWERNWNIAFQSDLFVINFETTQLIVSTLISGILFLNAFTLNILLVLLVTFSNQFSPRMMEDFISNKFTQHYIGLFNGNFIYVLFMFLFISNSRELGFVLVPVITVLLTLITAIGFIFFIHHATNWMYVHNVTAYMRAKSEEIIMDPDSRKIENHKVMKPGEVRKSLYQKRKTVNARRSGYIQLIDFTTFIDQAKEDDLIIEFHEKIGDFILAGNPLFSYWGDRIELIDEENYHKLIIIGHKETEIQDFNAAMNKLAELAIKALGSHDSRSAINSIHQLSDLMQTVDKYYVFTPYLADAQGQTRVITQSHQFKEFLYRGMGMIRHYASGNFPVITEIIICLRMLARSSAPIRHQEIWTFAENTIVNISASLIYDLDRKFLLEALKPLSEVTGNEKEYRRIEKQLADDRNY